MLVETEACENSPAISINQNNSRNPEGHPFSSSFPFTAVNRRRRVTCKNCDLPVGYIDIGQTHLEAIRCKKEQKCRTSSDDLAFESIKIPCPINVSLNPKRLGSCEIPSSENPSMTWIIKDAVGNAFNADEIICDGCGSSLGARIIYFERISPTTEGEFCESVEDLEEKSRWYSFSFERIEIEPFFGIIGLRELSSTFYGGERCFNEAQAIEDSDFYSNNSASWMKPHERVIWKNNQQGEIPRHTWPLLLMDLVRANELPEGTLGHLGVKEWALLDSIDAFTRPPPDYGIDDVSITYPGKCCSEFDNNAEMNNIE